MVEKTFRKISDDTDEGKTIFLRNVPFEMSEFSLKELIEEKFGETLYVKIVFSKLTQLPKGVAFVKFKNIESVEKVLEGEKVADRFYNDHIFRHKRKHISDPGNFSAIILPPEIGIQFNGRRIFARLALNRTEIANIENSKLSKDHSDNLSKNLDLLKKGLILPGMKEAEGISSHDLRLRENSWKEIKIKMNNPNYEVNKYRLCIRNIPTKIKSSELNDILIREISKMSDIEVQNLGHEIVSEFEKSENFKFRKILMSLRRSINSPKKCKLIFKRLINKVNIIRETSLKSSKPRGFAFVNTSSFSLSKSILEILNNNPKIFTSEKRPIVEFAIEDKRALFIQKKRMENFKRREKKSSEICVKEPRKTYNISKVGRGKRQRIKNNAA
ncbi:RNA recognition motif domain protein family protein [Cryptosporidium meleagridis]|uniref:RNA recognition motif domain protein family protein n=1 Tax=Cryptosporidium meleagridis TaxID=93969 RepID=A0A2P4Z6M4_9CRYT|nr:RNA recognition motif domain protein family protein [Cryptosporidium meleagridis]